MRVPLREIETAPLTARATARVEQVDLRVAAEQVTEILLDDAFGLTLRARATVELGLREVSGGHRRSATLRLRRGVVPLDDALAHEHEAARDAVQLRFGREPPDAQLVAERFDGEITGLRHGGLLPLSLSDELVCTVQRFVVLGVRVLDGHLAGDRNVVVPADAMTQSAHRQEEAERRFRAAQVVAARVAAREEPSVSGLVEQVGEAHATVHRREPCCELLRSGHRRLRRGGRDVLDVRPRSPRLGAALLLLVSPPRGVERTRHALDDLVIVCAGGFVQRLLRSLTADLRVVLTGSASCRCRGAVSAQVDPQTLAEILAAVLRLVGKLEVVADVLALRVRHGPDVVLAVCRVELVAHLAFRSTRAACEREPLGKAGNRLIQFRLVRLLVLVPSDVDVLRPDLLRVRARHEVLRVRKVLQLVHVLVAHYDDLTAHHARVLLLDHRLVERVTASR